MCKHQHPAVPLAHSIVADGGHHRRLAAAGRDHDDRVVVAIPQVAIHRLNGGGLIWAKRDHQAAVSLVSLGTGNSSAWQGRRVDNVFPTT